MSDEEGSPERGLLAYPRGIWGWLPAYGKAIALLVIVSALFALTPPGQTFEHELRHEVVIDETTTDGEDAVSDLELGTARLDVELTTTPSELGVRKLDLYENGEMVDSTSLSPRETSTSLYGLMESEDATWTLVAVDGSNRVVSEVKITFKEVPVSDD